jgi:hypothetical protein
MSTAKPTSDDVRAVTQDYESWLGTVIDLVPQGIEEKHQALAGGVLPFLRGTYYLWLVRVDELLPDVLSRPQVPIVGDVHVENFGTWRDAAQVRRWGVNDLDELASGSWLLDLLRLATSAAVAPHIHLGADDVCAELLTTYAAAQPGPSVDMAGKEADHLVGLVAEFKDPGKFYDELANGAPAHVPARVAKAAASVAETGWNPTWHEHEAGTGSLGHVRAVGVGPAADGTPHAREAKQLGPGTAVWAARWLSHPPRPGRDYAEVKDAVRGPAGATRVEDWQVRDLAPDVVRIELAGLPRHHERRLLQSMAQAVADVHGADATAAAAARADAGALQHDDFRAMVETMARKTREDAEAWRRGRP